MTERDPAQPSSSRPVDPTVDDAPTIAWTPPADDVVAPAPTPAAVASARRGGGLRWAVAGLVTVLVLGVAGAAVVLLSGQSAPSTVSGYALVDSVAYGELRLDLPGDQRQKLGQFLSKFPGFADQANLPGKVDEVLDRLVIAMTDGRQEFSRDIKPWFGGEIGFSIGSLPTPVDAAVSERGLLIVEVTDAAKARAWFDGLAADLPRTTTTHAGIDVILVGEAGKKGAVAFTGPVMLAGDEASVTAAIDSQGRSAFAAGENFKRARAALDGDGLGLVYVDMKQYMDWLARVAPAMPGTSMSPLLGEAYRALLPDWLIGRLRADGDQLRLDVVTTHVATKTGRQNADSALTPHLPASTIVFADGHEFGASIIEAIDLSRSDPSSADALRQIDSVANLLGGYPAILGWMDQAGFALTRTGTTVDGGLIVRPTEKAAADRFLTTLRSYATLAGQAGITIRDEAYNGVTITVVDLGDAGALAPPNLGLPVGGHLQIAWASTEEFVVVGVGQAFVKAVIDTRPDSSLAQDARYRSLIDRVGARNTGSVFVDIAAVRELIESLGASDPTKFAEYERDVKPYLLPLDAYIQAATVGDLDRTNAVLTVK